MKYYLITDTHFNHTEKMMLYCGRPADYEQQIRNNLCNLKLTEDDVLIHLGDICIGMDALMHEKWIKGLKCKMWLIKGNHDNQNNKWYLEHGWDFVADRLDFKFEGKRLCFTHIPVKDVGEFDYNIHGHFHNTLYRLKQGDYKVEGEKERNFVVLSLLTDKHKLLSMEEKNYKPIELSRMLVKNHANVIQKKI